MDGKRSREVVCCNNKALNRESSCLLIIELFLAYLSHFLAVISQYWELSNLFFK